MNWNVAQRLRDRADRRVIDALTRLDLEDAQDVVWSEPVPRWHSSLHVMRRSGLWSSSYYPAVARLEARGDVEAVWKSGGYPRQRMYRLIPRAEVIEMRRYVGE